LRVQYQHEESHAQIHFCTRRFALFLDMSELSLYSKTMNSKVQYSSYL